MVKLKYKEGQKLRLISQEAVDVIWDQLQDEHSDLEEYDIPLLEIGSIVIAYPSKRYSGDDSYGVDYEDISADPGFSPTFIEDKDKFKVISNKITDWKKELE